MGGVDMWHVNGERKSNLSAFDWSKVGDTPQTAMAKSSAQTRNDTPGPPIFDQARESNGFSSSLSSVLHEQLNFELSVGQLDDNGAYLANADEVLGPLDEELVSRAIGDLLPGDEEELLAGISWMNINGTGEEIEEFDLFSSGGGLEMDGEPQEGFEGFVPYMNSSRGFDGFYTGGSNFYGGPSSNGGGSVIGEHPFGEHPSRTLFVRNINSNVEDSELRALFEQYGDVRTLYTACKHRGFVMISYYDIRAARTAMRNLQNKPLRRRKLDIHFSIPKDNPSDKDINQGTLVVFNLDPSVSNDDLCQIFGHYGEVKEIRETPHKRHHKFIEYYDVRAAEAALRALNRSDIAGKRIKLEPSRPGGARRSLMQQLSQDSDQDDNRLLHQQLSPPVTNSPPGHISSWGNFGSPIESGAPRLLHHSLGTSVPNMTKSVPGLPVPTPPNHMRVGTIGSHLGGNTQMDGGLSSLPSAVGLGLQGLPSHHHAHSLPEHGNSGLPFYSPANLMLIKAASHGPLDSEGARLPRSSSSDVSLFEHAPGALGMAAGTGLLRRLNSASAGSSSLSGPQFLWGNSSTSQQKSLPPTWSNPPPVSHNLNSIGHQPFGYTGNHTHMNNNGLPLHRHHVGSAPSGVPSFLERQYTNFRQSPETSFFHPGSASGMDVPGGFGIMSNGGSHGVHAGSLGRNGFFEGGMSMGASHGFHAGSLGSNNSFFEGGSSPRGLGILSPHSRRGHMFPTSGMVMMGGGYFDMLGTADRGRIRRTENMSLQADNRKQYQLDIDRIVRGEDTRTTLMIKNIPNKYTSKMLLAAIDENHRGMYDFLYLPIDFKNKCNVGYAFINMTSPSHIISIYQAFNGKKWEKFNSEKVASLAYARIQGKAALVAHFQNSSLMNEDKRCRPIVFNSDGPDNGDQELSVLEAASNRLGYNREPMDNTEFMEHFAKAGNQEGLVSRSRSILGSSSLETE